jgi:hypothetical protein
MKAAKIMDGTDPGATPGRVFTASIPQETIIPEGGFLHYIKMGLKGAVSSAAVAVEAFAPVLSEYSFRVGPENRIVMNGQDLAALSAFYFKEQPVIGENTDNTGTDFLGNVKIPIFAKADPTKPFTHAATRTAVTNIGTETLAMTGYWDETDGGRKPIHAVKVPYTTAGSAGYDTVTSQIAPVGKLIGLLIKQVAGFDDGNIDVSVQRVRILANGQLHSQFNVLADAGFPAEIDLVTPSPMADLLRLYTCLDLRDSGIDAKGQALTVQLDVQDTSDAISIIPVLEIA